MKDFSGKIAVITGGGTGMGRELAIQLAEEGCDIAICDVSTTNMAETLSKTQERAAQGVRTTAYACDVRNADAMNSFAEHIKAEFAVSHINLLFNNAGIGGGGSFVEEARDDWERTFNVCWGGVYNGCRTFMDLLVASEEGHVINTSSINGFWASAGPAASHTAYSASKFAVKGFTEALVTDLRLNAPHVRASVVMPGHIGTSIILNGTGSDDPQGARTVLRMMGQPIDEMDDQEVKAALERLGEGFRDRAPTTAEDAVKIILAGVKEEKWRILVGDDAFALDAAVRAAPEEAYDIDFSGRLG
ncbi:MAG: SDR family NAD(P)-dependent oxidoreductase [Pseudomonadales bacterium]|nr:SDR family NAD(P)-dependent oxidoreductase [Pseudomonadales bacterium]